MIRDKAKPEKKKFARVLRSGATHAERVLWDYLRDENLGVKFRRQSIIRGYIADFYSPKVHIVVEVDGPIHNGRGQYDEKRDAVMKEIGIETLRFSNFEVLNEMETVISTIRNRIQARLTERITPFHGPIPQEKLKQWMNHAHLQKVLIS